MDTKKMPLNGPNYWRQLDILKPSDIADHVFVLIGVGGVGSPTALTISKMGAKKLIVYDDDTVENHNLPNQLFRYSDLKKAKGEAMVDILSEFAPTKVVAVNKRYHPGIEPLSGIVISAVDTMTARKEIWDGVRKNPNVPFYIEARMGAEVLRIHSLDPNSDLADWYETTLYSDEQAIKAPCTERAIIYTVMVAAGLIANQVKKYVRGETVQKEVVFDLKNMLLLT